MSSEPVMLMPSALAEAEAAAREAAEVARYEARAEAREKANADPLPGPLLDAFLAPEAVAAGLRLQPIVAYHLVLLRALDSPLLRLLAELGKPEAERREPEYSDDELFETLFVFTRPIAEVRTALCPPEAEALPGVPRDQVAAAKRRARVAFRQLALESIAYRLPTGDIDKVRDAVIYHFLKSLATQVAYEAPPSGDGTVFTPPPAGPRTGSAGGCTSSPACCGPIPA